VAVCMARHRTTFASSVVTFGNEGAMTRKSLYLRWQVRIGSKLGRCLHINLVGERRESEPAPVRPHANAAWYGRKLADEQIFPRVFDEPALRGFAQLDGSPDYGFGGNSGVSGE
jgi:hypothetical protein